jgi:hypothetical protein
MIEAGQGATGAGHEDAVITDVLIDVARHRVGVGMVEYSAALTQQLSLHYRVTLIVIMDCIEPF